MVESVSESSVRCVTDLTLKKSIKVLLVDDDLSFLKAAKQCLETQGEVQVETASSVEEAIERMKKEGFDIIVSDFKMPGKDGLEFLKELRERGNDVPFIIFTNKGREEIAIKALNLGADGYFSKFGEPETVYGELGHGIRQAVEKKKTDMEVWHNEERLKAIMASSPDAIIISDLNGNIVGCNEATLRLAGYSSKEEIVGKNSFEFIAEKDRERALKNLKKTFDQGTTKNVGYTLLKKGKEEYQGELSASVLKDSSGNLIGFVGIIRDITERKRSDAQLARLASFPERNPNPVLEIDLTGKTTYLNPAARKLLSQLHDSKLLDDFEEDLKVIISKFNTHRTENFVRENVKVGDRYYQYSIHYVAEDAVLRIYAIDTTERKQAEEVLRRSGEQARQLLGLQGRIIDTAIVWIDLLDREGNVTLWNRAAELISGYSREEVTGHKRIWEWLYPDPQYRAEIFARARSIINEKLEQNFETEIRCKNGASKTISWYTNSITDGKGKPVGSIAIGLDVSQLKKTEGELREALEKLEVMNEKLRVVGGLTRHDVRNKLSAFVGNAYLAKKETAGNSRVLGYLREIEEAVQQSAEIFNFAKTYEMLGAQELAYIDVEKTINGAISLFSDLKGAKVTNDCGGLNVLADSLLQQVCYNLIDNSLKYGKKITEIRVYYEKTGENELRLVYEDDGVGIATAEKQKLFNEGYSTGGSTGYGLYLMKKITEAYGWTIQETGESGKGARFVVTIPQTSPNGKENYRITRPDGT
jgi:PAS domain S-box-containing protein